MTRRPTRGELSVTRAGSWRDERPFARRGPRRGRRTIGQILMGGPLGTVRPVAGGIERRAHARPVPDT
jgi:hypothetical protein